MCAKCFTVTFYDWLDELAMCEMGWASFYFRVRTWQQSPHILISSLHAICLRVWAKGYHIFWFLRIYICMFHFGSPRLFIMVQFQNSNSELHGSHPWAAAKMSHGRPDPTLLACIMINSHYHTSTGTPFHLSPSLILQGHGNDPSCLQPPPSLSSR